MSKRPSVPSDNANDDAINSIQRKPRRISKPKAAPEPTITEIGKQFFKYGVDGLSPLTQAAYSSYIGGFINQFGDATPSTLSVLAVATWINGQTTWKSSSTFATAIRCIKRLFNWAVRARMIKRNPLVNIRKPAGESRRNWTPDEFRQVVRRAAAVIRRLLYFSAWTGARIGEVRAIEWQHIDWQRHCVVLTEHKTAKTQSKPRPRIIPLLPVTERLLRWIWRRRPNDPHVFLNFHKAPWTTENLTARLHEIRDRGGLPNDLKMYGVRHLFATEAVRRGVEIKSLAELMGHTTTRMTEKYTHIAGDVGHLLEAAIIVNQSRRGAE